MNKYPRASKYDPEWMKANMMGPNAVYLLELLCEHMDLHEGMRVLDLGCGRGITSVFLAKEFGVNVWATDLWIPATDNYIRFKEAGVDDRVFPIHADAHDLPYADGFFDAMVSIDAYQYFGTENDYMDVHCARLIKDNGQIGIVVPGLSGELTKGEMPRGLDNFWHEDFKTFHSADWWKDLWDNSPSISTGHCENMQNGRQIWYDSIWRQGDHSSDFDRQMLNADKDGILTLIMITGIKI